MWMKGLVKWCVVFVLVLSWGSVNSAPGDSGYVREVLHDEPVEHWRLSSKQGLEVNGAKFVGRGAVGSDADGALSLGKTASVSGVLSGFGGDAVTLEFWLRARTQRSPRDVIAIATAKGVDTLVVGLDKGLVVSVLGEQRATGVAVEDGAWHHVGIVWRGKKGELAVVVDGRERWRAALSAKRSLPSSGTVVLGRRASDSDGLDGVLDELVLYNRAMSTSRLLSHSMVARGSRAAAPSSSELPLRLVVGGEGRPGGRGLAQSPDGRLIASATNKAGAVVHSVRSGHFLFRLGGHAAPLRQIHFSPDGRYATTADTRGVAVLWDMARGERVRRLSAEATTAVPFTPDGLHVVWGERSGAVVLGAVPLGTASRRPPKDRVLQGSRDSSPIASVDIDAGGQWLTATRHDGVRRLYALRSGRVKHTLTGSKRPTAAAFVAGGARVVGAGSPASSQSELRVWDVDTGGLLRQVQLPGRVRCLSAHPSKALVLASGPGWAGVWGVESGEKVWHQKFKSEASQCASFSPEGRWVLSAGPIAHGDSFAESLLKLWDADTGAEVWTLDERSSAEGGRQVRYRDRPRVPAIFSHDGQSILHIASGVVMRSVLSGDFERRIAGGATERASGQAGEGRQRVESVPLAAAEFSGEDRFSADSRWVRVAGGIWDLKRLALVQPGPAFEIDTPGVLVGLADGSGFVVARRKEDWNRLDDNGEPWLEGGLVLLDRYGAQRHDFGGTDGLFDAVSVSPDGARAVSFESKASRLRVWDVQSGAEVSSWAVPRHKGWPKVRFSPRGDWVMLEGQGISLFHVGNNEVVAEGQADVRFSPDGRWLVMERLGEKLVMEAATEREVGRFIGLVIRGGTPKEREKRVRKLKWMVSKTPERLFHRAKFLADSQHMATWDPSGGWHLWSLAFGDRVRHVKAEGKKSSMGVSPDGAWAVRQVGPDEVSIEDPVTGRAAFVLKGAGLVRTSLRFSPKGVWVAGLVCPGKSPCPKRVVRFWSMDTGKHLRDAPEPPCGLGSEVALSPDGALALSGDGLWSLDGGEGVRFRRKGDQWLIHGEDGVFSASPHGDRLAHMVQGAEAYGLDQLAVAQNRPDVLMERLGVGTEAQRQRDRATHRRRLRRLGLDKASAGTGPKLPVARIVRQGEVTRRGQVAMTLQFRDSKALAGYQVWVNNVPVFAEVPAVSGTRAEVNLDLALVKGVNKIEVSAFNRGGWESHRALRQIELRDPSLQMLAGGQKPTHTETFIVQRKEAPLAAYVPAQKAIVTGGAYREVLRMWSSETGELLAELGGEHGWTMAMAVSADGAKVASGTWDGTVQVWDLSDKTLLQTLGSQSRAIRQLTFSPDGTHLVVVSSSLDLEGEDEQPEGGALSVWHVPSGKKVWSREGWGRLLGFDPSGEGFLALVDGAVSRGRLDSDALTFWSGAKGPVDSRRVYHAALSSDGAWLVSLEEDAVTAWSVATGEQVCRWPVAEPRSLAIHPSQPFVALTSEPFEAEAQLFVLDVRQCATPTILRTWEEGASIEGVSALTWSADGDVLAAATASEVELWRWKAGSVERLEPLDSSNIDGLLFGPDGRHLLALRNSASEPMDLWDLTARAADRPDLYALVIGVSSYKNSELDLEYAHKDAQDLAAQLGQLQGYKSIKVRVLTDADATVSALQAASAFVEAARPQDTLVLFVAGHGMHSRDEAGTYFYLTHEADPEDLPNTAASFESIESVLTRSPSRNKLFLMDTCESGELEDEGARASESAVAGQRGLVSRGFRPTSVSLESGGEPVSRPVLRSRRDRFIDQDLARRSGAIVFSSSRGGEFSYESPSVENGFFTEEVLAALSSPVADVDKDGAVSTDELRRHVSAAVSRVTGGLQNPTVDRDNIYQRFGFILPSPPATPPTEIQKTPPTQRGCVCGVLAHPASSGTPLGLLTALLLLVGVVRRRHRSA